MCIIIMAVDTAEEAEPKATQLGGGRAGEATFKISGSLLVPQTEGLSAEEPRLQNLEMAQFNL